MEIIKSGKTLYIHAPLCYNNKEYYTLQHHTIIIRYNVIQLYILLYIIAFAIHMQLSSLLLR